MTLVLGVRLANRRPVAYQEVSIINRSVHVEAPGLDALDWTEWTWKDCAQQVRRL